MVDDAEALEAFDRLGREHRSAVVGQKSARKPALLKGLRQAVNEDLRGLFEVPLEVAAETRAVIENTEHSRLSPLSVGRQHGPRPLMEVQVPEAVHVGDSVRAPLACFERRLAVGVFPVAAFAGTKQPLPLHEPAHGGVAGHRAEAGVFAGERDEVVVVQLEAPARMVAVLLRERLGDGGAQARMRSSVRGHLARQHRERIVGAAGDVPPSLEGLEREADGLARGRVPPGARGKRLDACLELAVVGGGRQEGAEDLKAQTRPSHAHAGHAVIVGHGSPARQRCNAAARRTLCRWGKHGQRHLLRELRGGRGLHHGPHPT